MDNILLVCDTKIFKLKTSRCEKVKIFKGKLWSNRLCFSLSLYSHCWAFKPWKVIEYSKPKLLFFGSFLSLSESFTVKFLIEKSYVWITKKLLTQKFQCRAAPSSPYGTQQIVDAKKCTQNFWGATFHIETSLTSKRDVTRWSAFPSHFRNSSKIPPDHHWSFFQFKLITQKASSFYID